MLSQLKATPWDALAFNMDTYEIVDASEDVLLKVQNIPGHYTVRVNPLDIAKKKLMNQYGFYYCDTLIELYVKKEFLKSSHHEEISMSTVNDLNEIIPLIDNNFVFDRFHRDFNIDSQKADLRYRNWVFDLIQKFDVFKFLYKDNIIGFLAYRDNTIQIHSMSKEFQGKGLAKYCWSLICNKLLASHAEISSSSPAANLAIINLYISLGFKFRKAEDTYHGIIK